MIKFEDLEKEEFAATVGKIYCDKTNKLIAELIVRDMDEPESPVQRVFARSPFHPGHTEGPFEIQGMLSYGPSDHPSNPTIVRDVEYDVADDNIAELTLDIIKK